MAKTKIEPNITLTIYTHQICSIIFIVKDQQHNILYMNCITYNTNDVYYNVRRKCIVEVKNIIEQFTPDTILLEQTKLFTDGISKYPDPEVYKNIVISYGLQISMEDNFLELVEHFLVIPYYEWSQLILGTKFKYILDRCKNHILLDTKLTEEQLKTVKQFNIYQALCFSECTKHNKLMDKKFKIR